MNDLVSRLIQIKEAEYGLGFTLSQVRKIASDAAIYIEKLSAREKALKDAINAIKEVEE